MSKNRQYKGQKEKKRTEWQSIIYKTQHRQQKMEQHGSSRSCQWNVITYYEWMSDCRQLSNFSAISWREQFNFQWDGDEIHFVLDQNAEFDFHSSSSLKQVRG